MLSSQVIRSSLEQLRTITKVEFCVQDLSGAMIAQTEAMMTPDKTLVAGFARPAVDSQIIGNSYQMKVMDENEPLYVLTAVGNADYTFMVARIAVSQIESLIAAGKERLDRSSFSQGLLLDDKPLVYLHPRAENPLVPASEPNVLIL